MATRISESERRPPRRSEAGYSLLMAVFLVATMLIVSMAAAPNILTQGRREQETEMVWRGEQYERAIGLYFRKFGRYPTKIEDLTNQTNGVRFLRQAYKDPTNKEDGTWRFIYVGPNGQLIGSTRVQSLVQGLMSQPGAPGIASQGLAAPPPPQNGAGNGTGNGASGAPGGQQNAAGAPGSGGAGSGGGSPDAQQTDTGSSGSGPGSQQNGFGSSSFGTQGAQQIGPGSSGFGSQGSPFTSAGNGPQPITGQVIGGNIIGVGSKTKKRSLRVYMKGDSYDKWEFIWNPLQQTGIVGQQAPANLAPGSGGVSPTGQSSPVGAASGPNSSGATQAPTQ